MSSYFYTVAPVSMPPPPPPSRRSASQSSQTHNRRQWLSETRQYQSLCNLILCQYIELTSSLAWVALFVLLLANLYLAPSERDISSNILTNNHIGQRSIFFSLWWSLPSVLCSHSEIILLALESKFGFYNYWQTVKLK